MNRKALRANMASLSTTFSSEAIDFEYKSQINTSGGHVLVYLRFI